MTESAQCAACSLVHTSPLRLLFLRRSALLASGDAAALLLFASIGRSNHGEGLAPAAVLATAAPFLLGVPKILALALSNVVVKVC